jgi:hypothetical protein
VGKKPQQNLASNQLRAASDSFGTGSCKPVAEETASLMPVFEQCWKVRDLLIPLALTAGRTQEIVSHSFRVQSKIAQGDMANEYGHTFANF